MNGRHLVSLFSGVGGFEYGFEQAGFETVYQCEIDAKCRSVLRRHFPKAEQWSDISTLRGKQIADAISARGVGADVVVWGSPCQDLSVAGLGGGLSGERSGLFYEGIRVITELRKETNNVYPRISVWENVPGALSSNKGADFGRVIDTMAEAGALVVEWRVLDARFFGVPQRRRRVFVVAVFDPATAERCSDPILPISESMRRNPASGGSPQQETPDDSPTSVGSGSGERSVVTATGFADFEHSEQIGPLTTKVGRRIEQIVIEPIIGFSHTQGLSPQPSEQAFPTLRREGSGMAVSYTLRDREGKPGGGKGLLISPESALTLKTSNDLKLFIDDAETVLRRLTPMECERLMGWQDDWTRLADDGTEIADTHRYKMCGNGVASPVAKWVAERIARIL
jgi:DNA (cytosine-5)-methyltransferase 1